MPFRGSENRMPGLDGMIECLHSGVSAKRARVALFDFDGTLSLIRTGWVDVMVPTMVEILAALGSGESQEELRALVEDYVARLTGEQTVYQMIELARQVELRGGRPLDPLAYKKMYHERLMGRVRQRREDLRRGATPPEKFLVPGARELLEVLRARGMKLYCASGTDQDYTREETQLLDIARYFDGGVYGALDDYKSFSKAILIRQILSSTQYRGEELLGFGDGYVEIKNVKESGGIAVGVATDEPECRKVNEKKRQRLVSVGADFVVPNFLDHEQLLRTLFEE
jgi:phosphoglycolate phosphatase